VNSIGAKVDLSGPVGQKTTTTDNSGNYIFNNLQVGSGYAISVSQAGFGIAKSTDVSVGVNQRTTSDITLVVGNTAQSIDITDSGANAIDLATTTVGANLDESLYKNVAVGRNISAIVNLAPGVSSGGGTGDANPSINGASGLGKSVYHQWCQRDRPRLWRLRYVYPKLRLARKRRYLRFYSGSTGEIRWL